MASQVAEVKTLRVTNTHARSSTGSRGVKSPNPKLGDFGRINTKAPLCIKPKTAATDTGPSGTAHETPPCAPRLRARVVHDLVKPVRLKLLDIDKASISRCLVAGPGDSPVSTVENDSHGLSDDASVCAPVSPATIITSPDVSPQHLSDKETKLTPLLPGSYPDLSPLRSRQLPDSVRAAQHGQQYSIVDHNGFCRRITPDELNSSLYQELVRAHRVKLAHLAGTKRSSSAAEELTLPWDLLGNYTNGTPPRTVGSHRHFSRHTIEPLYRVDRQLQLRILTAWLDEAVCDDDYLRSQLSVSNQPIHVFVDMSNIVIGFYNRLKAERRIGADERVQAPPFFFEGLAHCLERRRPCAKRVLATSLKAGAATPGYLLEAESHGYEVNVLQRVRGSKRNRQGNPLYQGHGGIYMPDSDSETGYREQGVDELLHLKMMHSLVDAREPGTMVLATGDAAEAEFSDGFHKNVVRALERGWHVEVVGFRDNISFAWFDPSFNEKWPSQFRIFCLDPLVEELIAGYHM